MAWRTNGRGGAGGASRSASAVRSGRGVYCCFRALSSLSVWGCCCFWRLIVLENTASGSHNGRVWEGNPNRLDYTTSKAGVIGLTRALAREVGDDKIRVNAVTPGFTLSETQLASSSSNYMAGRDDGKCFKRAQVPDDLVGTVMFLLSDAASYMTGQTINVDGGLYMH